MTISNADESRRKSNYVKENRRNIEQTTQTIQTDRKQRAEIQRTALIKEKIIVIMEKEEIIAPMEM